jgi:hypothetical protein
LRDTEEGEEENPVVMWGKGISSVGRTLAVVEAGYELDVTP